MEPGGVVSKVGRGGLVTLRRMGLAREGATAVLHVTGWALLCNDTPTRGCALCGRRALLDKTSCR